MVFVPVTIKGGLPVIAEVWFSGPDIEGEYDAGCDGLYWQKKDGSKGSAISQKVLDSLEKYDSHWEGMVTEQANDWLSGNCPRRYRNPHYRPGQSLSSMADNPEYIEEGEWSEEYILLNGDSRKRRPK